MTITTFIKRPILSTVISALIVLVGVLGAMTLPIERYPDIAPPTVSVSTYFYGADAETIIKSVITPLEEEINGVENMMYMTSSAANTGEITIDITFKQGSNADMNTVNVLNRVQKVTSKLPQEVRNMGVTVEKKQNSILQMFTISSPDDSYDFAFLSNYASINIKPQILLINGIGKFQMLGSDYSMRIWLKPSVLAEHKLNPSDVLNALNSQNLEAATGSFGDDSDETYHYTMKYTGRLKSTEEFGNIIISSLENGEILRLRDIADIELGCESYRFSGMVDGHPGVMCICYQASGSNATEVNNNISDLLEKMQEEAPSGVQITQMVNTNDFLYAAIDQVVDTLRDAIILVILIVLIFLKDFKSTLIPFISILVSLIGTFAFMTIAGFSINLLTLFALVLVIGTVVDDSIVVVEAVHAKFEAGVLDPFKATAQATKEVAMPVITSSLVFMAVFIPVSFMPGTSGIFYKQFGLTMAVAVGISALNALTLVPALAAMMLSPIKKFQEGQKNSFQQRYARWFDGMFDRFTEGYKKFLAKFMNKKWIIWTVAAAGGVGIVLFLALVPSGLVPQEDQGTLLVELSTPPGTSLHKTMELSKEISARVLEVPGVRDVATNDGFGFIAGSSSSASCLILKLKDWGERSGESSLMGIMKNVRKITDEYPSCNAIIFDLPMIPGYGTNSGIDMYIQDRKGGTIQELFDVTTEFLKSIQKYGLGGYVAFNIEFPQWEVSVDVAKCMRAGLSASDVLSALGTYFGSSYCTDINLYSKVYKVTTMATPDARRTENDLNSAYIRTADGEMAPLSGFLSLKKVFGPEVIKNFNKFTAINVSVTTSLSTGEALDILAKASKEDLPEGYTIDYAGMTREQKSQGSLGAILILCIFIIYLILCALYESYLIPLCVILTVPLGLAGAYAVTLGIGLDNNIYVQTGVIMLIGLLAKTAILITEYAVDKHKAGMDITQAAIEAAGVRLRPIIMTVATMAIGLMPLVLSVGGVGGNGNFSLGSGTISGLIIGTIGLLFITPVLFTTFQRLQDKMKKSNYDDDEE